MIELLPMLAPAAERCGATAREDADPGPFIRLRPCHLPVGHERDGETRAHAHRAVAVLAPETPISARLYAEWSARLDISTDHRNGCGTCDWLGMTLCDEGVRLEDAERAAYGAYYEARYAAPIVSEGQR